MSEEVSGERGAREQLRSDSAFPLPGKLAVELSLAFSSLNLSPISSSTSSDQPAKTTKWVMTFNLLSV